MAKTNLTKATQEQICVALKIGATLSLAVRYADAEFDIVQQWVNEGKDIFEKSTIDSSYTPTTQEKKRLAFYQATENAKAEHAINCLNVVNQAAMVDPRWAWTVLQNRFADDYGEVKRQRIEHSGAPNGHPIAIQSTSQWDLSKLSDEQLGQLTGILSVLESDDDETND